MPFHSLVHLVKTLWDIGIVLLGSKLHKNFTGTSTPQHHKNVIVVILGNIVRTSS